jgi:hypothetical protein
LALEFPGIFPEAIFPDVVRRGLSPTLEDLDVQVGNQQEDPVITEERPTDDGRSARLGVLARYPSAAVRDGVEVRSLSATQFTFPPPWLGVPETEHFAGEDNGLAVIRDEGVEQDPTLEGLVMEPSCPAVPTAPPRLEPAISAASGWENERAGIRILDAWS